MCMATKHFTKIYTNSTDHIKIVYSVYSARHVIKFNLPISSFKKLINQPTEFPETIIHSRQNPCKDG